MQRLTRTTRISATWLALLGMFVIASGAGQFTHVLTQHSQRHSAAAHAHDHAPASPSDSRPPAEPQDDCETCHLLAAARAMTLGLLPTVPAPARLLTTLTPVEQQFTAATSLHPFPVRGPPLRA